MWQRFSESARKAVFYAREEAQSFGEGYVSTEHLLLGLVRGSGPTAVQILEALKISCDQVRSTVTKRLPRGDSRQDSDMTLTPRAKRVVDLAYDEARNLGHNYIGTEHLLLGLIREHDGLAGRVLAKLGAQLDAARVEVAVRCPPSPGARMSAQSNRRPLPHQRFSWQAIDEDGRASVFYAQEATLKFGSTEVMPEHLLLGILHAPEAPATKILADNGINGGQIISNVEHQLPVVEQRGPKDLHLSNSGKKIIEVAYAEAVALGHSYSRNRALPPRHSFITRKASQVNRSFRTRM